MTIKPVPFTLHIPDADIADLRDRLARSRFPDSAPGEAWAYGTNVAYLRELTEYWRTTFDWRAEEAALNAFPQFRAALEDVDHCPEAGNSKAAGFRRRACLSCGDVGHMHSPTGERARRRTSSTPPPGNTQ